MEGNEISTFKDLTGKRFGRLEVIDRGNDIIYNPRSRVVTWNCKCDCGKIVNVPSQRLTTGNTKSCGCYRSELLKDIKTKYKDEKTKELRIRYKGMKQRCENENSGNYKYYGGRGIKICDEWSDDFFKFAEWSLDNGYDNSLTLDRVDVNKDYSPENCRWVSWRTQQNNRRNNKRVTVFGKTYTIRELSNAINVNISKIKTMINNGTNIEDFIIKNKLSIS